MFTLVLIVLRTFRLVCHSRSQLVLENLALRHQLLVLQRTLPKPRLRNSDRVLWLVLQRALCTWRTALVPAQPQTLVKWHRLGFRLFWRWKSRACGGRPGLDGELIALIEGMWSANSTWGSKRIQAELAKLGIRVSDSTVRKYCPKTRLYRRGQTWKSFLHNHAKEIVSVDFLTVPTATFPGPLRFPAPGP